MTPDVVNLIDNRDRTVTVTEIEICAAWSPFSDLVLSVGWMFQAWTGLESSIGQAVVIDTGQAIAFDGLVARAIVSY